MSASYSVQLRSVVTILKVNFKAQFAGLFLLVLEYVLKYGHSDDRLYERPKLKCYELLRRISRKNPKVRSVYGLKLHRVYMTIVGTAEVIP